MTSHRPVDRSLRRRYVRAARGITLIEVMTVMAASVVLLGATATALVAIHQADRRWSQTVDEVRSREQMLSQLRRDLHAAQSFIWNPADASLRITLADGGELTYQRRPRRWERRLEPAADAVGEVAGQAQKAALATAFPAPAAATWDVAPADGGVGDLIRIRLVQKPQEAPAAAEEPDAAELVVVVGRDWRLLRQ